MSAIDPVTQVQRPDGILDIRTNLRRTLERLAELPPSVGAPYITATLSWRPQGSEPQLRAARMEFEQAADRLLDGPHGRSAATESLQADVDRIKAYLAEEAPDTAHGLIIVACHAEGVFTALPLGVDVETSVDVGPAPVLIDLARVAEDYPTYAVLLADQREATLSLVTQNRARPRLEMTGTDYPTKQQQGGWSQRRFQSRADERVEHFLSAVADETRKVLELQHRPMLILAGDNRTTSALRDQLHESIADTIIGTLHLDIDATDSELVDATWPLVAGAEREHEFDAVEKAIGGAAAEAEGAVGAEDVLTSLQSGQVMTLVMNADFSAEGWADYSMPLFGIGEMPETHPAGGDTGNLTPVQIETEMVRLALQSDADIEIVQTEVPVSEEEQQDIRDADEPRPRSEAAKKLDEVGGVGAILRFALHADQATAEM
ncbi:MAG: Vms1/Ankzf1 family peptidyl-tRNA hydrolase [Thermomicrobiales bacterium]